MKKLNEGRFLHAKSRSCDNEFHATKFIYFCITAVCYVKTESNDRCSETRFVLVWCMLFFINQACIATTGAIQGTSCERLFLKNKAQNLQKIHIGIQNSYFFRKLWTELPQGTLLTIRAPMATLFTTHEHLTKTISEGLSQKLNISNNRFSLSVSMNGTN